MLKFRYLIPLAILMAIPGIVLAAGVTFSDATIFTFTAGNCTVSSGSTATSTNLSGNSLTLIQGSGDDFTITCPSTIQLTANPVLGESCNGGSRVYRSTAGVVLTTTFTAAAVTTSCGSTTTSGGGSAGGGGGGGGGSGSASASPVVVAAPVGKGSASSTVIVYDVPDNGQSGTSKLSVVDPAQKMTLEIAAKTKFKTDVKKQKVVNYTDIVKAPAVVANKDVVIDKKAAAAKATLLLAAKVETTAKQVKLNKFAMLSMPITEAQKKLGIKKLKAYYIDQNTGRAKALSGSKINKDKNLFIAKLKQLGGVVILTQKK